MVPVVLAALYFGGVIAGVVSAVVGIILSVAICRMSPKILLKWYGARKMSRENFVYPYLAEYSSNADIPMPQPYVFDSAAPVTFTVGNNNRYHVLMSTALLDVLNEDELRSMLALEVAKISKGSVPANTVVAFLAGIIASFSTVALWMAMLTGFGQEDDPAPRFISFLAMGLVSLPSALIVHLFSIDSGMEADRTAASIVAEPHVLARALERSGTYIKLHVTGGFNPGHVHLFSVNPLKTNTLFDVYSSMFLTSPDVNQRVNYLEKISPVCQY